VEAGDNDQHQISRIFQFDPNIHSTPISHIRNIRMVQVQSSLFPLYDRNPQSYVENMFNARAGDYKVATQSVYYGAGSASRVVLPVAGR
jgi:hypothetical protein